ncbi:MAG: YitT family protein [Lachnospiraceae bacterium]|nr:YitT family protein [Lachnospiraceae bacterium]
MKSKLKRICVTILGTFFMAAGVTLFLEPMDMVTGGVTGLAIIVKDATGSIWNGGIPLWITNAICNVLLFTAGYFVLGKKYLKKTIFATVIFTIFLSLIPEIDLVKGDYILATVFGSMTCGIGFGLVFSTGSSTGGTDMLAAMIHKQWRAVSLAHILLAIDGCIVVIGGIIYGATSVLYAVITVYLTTRIMNAVLEGMKFAKMAWIISDQYKEISQEVLYSLDRGGTVLDAEGMYSNDEKKMLVCVVSSKELIELMDIVDKYDKNAFMIVSDVREVRGEGFRPFQ